MCDELEHDGSDRLDDLRALDEAMGWPAMAVLVKRHRSEYERLVTEIGLQQQVDKARREQDRLRRELKKAQDRNPEGVNVPALVKTAEKQQQQIDRLQERLRRKRGG